MVNYNSYQQYIKDGAAVRCPLCNMSLSKLTKKISETVYETIDICCTYAKCKLFGGKNVMIKLDKKWNLNADAHGFTIGQMVDRKNKSGEMEKVYLPEYNYGTLVGALQGYVKIKGRDAIRKDVVVTLDALLELLPKIDLHCETIAKRIKEAK